MSEQLLDKEQIYNYGLLFSIAKAAVSRTLKCKTNKTDRIIFNSVIKAVERHSASKQEI